MIEKMNPHYSFNNPASIHDEEALTALELAGRQGAKINDVIEDQNNLRNETEAHLNQQDATIKLRMDKQDNNIKLRMDVQDNNIKQMNEVSMPGNVHKEMVQQIENGTFAGEINKFAGNLEERLNNLLSSYTPGTTSSDAELIDIRTGDNGTIFNTAGESVRSQFETNRANTNFIEETFHEMLSGSSIYTTRKIEFKNGGIDPNTHNDVVSPTQICSNYYPVTGKTEIIFDDSVFDCEASYYDTNKKFSVLTGFIETSPISIGAAANRKFIRLMMKKKSGAAVSGKEGSAYIRNYHPNSFLYVHPTCIENVESLPNVNSVEKGSVYRMIFGQGSTTIPEGLPFTSWPGGVGTLITFPFDIIGTATVYGTQILLCSDGIWYRYAGHDYNNWYKLGRRQEGTDSVTVRNGESILEGVMSAYNNGVNRVDVEAGNYDIIEEYKNHYGTDYFTTYTGYADQTDKNTRGIWLENMEIIFNPGAKVSCHYTGANANVPAYFSAFACGNNVVIDGLDLDSSNLRYGIHPDFNTGSDRTYFTVKNCKISHNKTSDNSQALGCGLGIHVDWLFENNVFVSHGSSAVVKIHNNESNECCSNVRIKDCYIEGDGHFEFNRHSKTTKPTTIIVSGCSYKRLPVVGRVTTGSPTDNMKLYAFNNEVR